MNPMQPSRRQVFAAVFAALFGWLWARKATAIETTAQPLSAHAPLPRPLLPPAPQPMRPIIGTTLAYSTYLGGS